MRNFIPSYDATQNNMKQFKRKYHKAVFFSPILNRTYSSAGTYIYVHLQIPHSASLEMLVNCIFSEIIFVLYLSN